MPWPVLPGRWPIRKSGTRCAGIKRVEPWVLFAGRLIFGGYFLYNGINHFLERESLVAYAKSKGMQRRWLALGGSFSEVV